MSAETRYYYYLRLSVVVVFLFFGFCCFGFPDSQVPAEETQRGREGVDGQDGSDARSEGRSMGQGGREVGDRERERDGGDDGMGGSA